MSVNNSILIISCLIHVILLFYLLKSFGPGKWLLPVLVWFLLMSLARFIYPLLDDNTRNILLRAESIWMPPALLCVFLLVLGSLFGALRGILGRRIYHPRRSRLAWISILISLLFCAYCLLEANLVLVARHLSVTTDKLPASAEPVRVVFVTDIHLGDWIGPWHLQRLADKIQAQRPDIIILGGDIVDGGLRERPGDLEILRALEAPGGKFAVLGNHEVYNGLRRSIRFLEGAGYQLLRQDSVQTMGIRLVGVDDPNADPAAADPLPILERLDQNRFILLIKHRPSVIPESVGLFDQQLSGHTHGGQVWPVRYLTSLYNNSSPGSSVHFGRGKVSLAYVSNGTGFSKTPMRFLTPPEIVVLDILPQGAAQTD